MLRKRPRMLSPAAAAVPFVLVLAACGDTGTAAEKACQAVTAELMRSPDSLRVASRFGHGDEVFMEVRAHNAYGTEVRSSVMCEVEGGQESDRVTKVLIDGEEMDPFAVLAARTRVGVMKNSKDLQ